jgi:predicted nucleic acid-binding protein
MKYVVDTNIINWLIDKKIDSSELPRDGELVATHIQIDEINRTSDEDRRARLFITVASTIRELLPTETTVADVSRFDWCKMGDGDVYTSIKSQLDAVNRGRPSNIRDALIAEVAVVNGFTLLTADRDLAMVVESHNGAVRRYAV